jgi:hypothetical protein
MARRSIIEIHRKPTAVQVRAMRTGLQRKDGIIDVTADKRTHEGIVGRGMADWVPGYKLGRKDDLNSYCVILKRGRDYLAKLDAAAAPAQEPVSAPQTAEEAPAAPVAAEAAPAPVEAPLAPVEDEFPSMGAAVDFLARLKAGDRVRITQHGRTNDYTVSRTARRSGSQGTVKVTVSLGPGRYSFEVSAGDLFAQRGDKATMTLGGTRMSRTPMITPTTTQETPMAEPTAPAPKTVGPRLAAAYERRDAVLAAMDAGRAVEYLPAHKVMGRVRAEGVAGMRATRAYWVNANNGAEEVALRSTQEQARTYAHSFKPLARVEHGPHACTLVFADGTTEELISYDVVCILPAA